jgi:uncharacterized protein (TIGR02145 family)
MKVEQKSGRGAQLGRITQSAMSVIRHSSFVIASTALLLCASCKKDKVEQQEEKKVESVEILSDDPVQIDVDGSVTLDVEVLPKKATDKSLTWESSNEDIVTVNKNGMITGVSKGTAKISATSVNRKSRSDTITVNVRQPVPATAISLDGDKSLEIGETVTVSAVVTPVGFTSTLSWTIANSSVADITPVSGNKCQVAGKTAGTTTLTLTADNGKKASCTITVLATRIALTKQIIDIGETVTVEAVVSPSNVTIRPNWTIANSAIATITPVSGKNQCKVKGVAAGTTRLTVTSDVITASCDIIVLPSGAVLINGVIWATRNVATVGTFSATPETWGWFYQWNRKKAYETESVAVTTGWDSSDATGTTWAAANDPSPSGWRVPTIEEFATLCDYTKVDTEWKTQNGKNGMLFTDKTTGKKMFMPAGGQRHPDTGKFMDYGLENGYYWSSTAYQSTYARYLHFDIVHLTWDDISGVSRTYGRPIRPVLSNQ